MTKRRTNSQQPRFSARIWPDLSLALQVWARICQDSDRLPTFDTMKAEGTHDGPWHTDGNINYRRLERTVYLFNSALNTELEIKLVGFEIYEPAAEKPEVKWHVESASLVGRGEVEVWESTQEPWMRNTPHSPVKAVDTTLYYVEEKYYNVHAL